MLIGKKKKIAKYLKEREDNFSNFDFILNDYLSGNLITELKKIGLSKIEIHIDWFDDIKDIGIQAKHKDYFLDIQIDKEELAIGCSKDEPNCNEFIAISGEPDVNYIYVIIKKCIEQIQ